MFLTLLLTAVPSVSLLPAASTQDPEAPAAEEPASSLEQIEPAAAAKELRAALKAKDDDISVATLKAVGRVPSKLVTKEVAKGLKFQSPAVVLAALQALRYNTDPSALDLLLKAKTNKTMLKDADTAAAYAYALGQKANIKCLKPLTADLVATAKIPAVVLKAKITAIGRIRHKDAVEAILDYCRTGAAGGRARGGVRKIMKEAQGALIVLTGTDQGTKLSAWQDWWYGSRNSFKMSEKAWPLGNDRSQRQWDFLWMTPEEKEAAKKSEREKRKPKPDQS